MTRKTDSLGAYLAEIGRIPLLTPGEELHLGSIVQELMNHPGGPDSAPRSLQRRGQRAKDRMITANLRLVVNVARRHGSRDADLADLIQEGTIGMMRGVEKFDPTRGYKFSTYAYWWIRQAISRKRTDGVVYLPVNVIENAGTLRRVTAELEREGVINPSFEMIASRCNRSVSELRTAADAMALLRMARLDAPAPTSDGNGSALGELVAAPGLTPWERLDQLDLEPVVQRLSQAADEVALVDLVAQGHTAGELLGVSQGRGRQLLREARVRLRELAGDEALELLRTAG